MTTGSARTPDVTRIFLLTATLTVFSCVSILPESSTKSPAPFPPECRLGSERFSWPVDHPPKLVWLSIDSLNESGLKLALRSIPNPHPSGFKRILESRNKKAELKIQEPTITASSHISTITCSPAGRHGTFANSQWNGNAMISGFVRPYATETFATAIKNSGRKVVAAAYPTLDNQEPTRSVTEGFTYGASVGRSAVVKNQSKANLKHSWSLNEGELTFEVSLQKDSPIEPGSFACQPQPCDVTPSGVKDIFDVTFRRPLEHLRAYIQILNENEVYFSQLKKNGAFPERVSELHRECGLLFSPGKNPSLSEYGVQAITGGMKHNLRYFALNWAHYLPSTRADALFMYLEDLDALRHQLADRISSEINSIAHLAEVDRLLGEFLESLPKETNVVILGDHGMTTIKTELNVRQILPAKALKQSQIVTSGGSLFLYGLNSQSKSMSSEPNPEERAWLREAQKSLLNFRIPGNKKSIFAEAFIKGSDEMKKAGLAHADSPFLIAFADPDFSLKESLDSRLILADASWPEGRRPMPPGQHGHTSSHKAMQTFVTGWGPQLDAVRFDSLSNNLDLVPAVGQALGWPVPAHCSP